jgi:hypothetical protein
MANYPFKVNIETGDGDQYSYYTSSFATDADLQISSSNIVDRINIIPVGSPYIQSEEAVSMHASKFYANSNAGTMGIDYISASFTEPHTGSITFTDTETTTNGGLKSYTFWGSKVCSVLGLPEGIPIYTENFKLSDDTNDPTNYLSGDVIANGVTVAQSFKMAPQGRMRSSLMWDEQFGDGYVKWVSGSVNKLSIGYDDVKDAYQIFYYDTSNANPLQISGSVSCKNQLAANAIVGSTVTATGTGNAFLGDQLRPRAADTELTLTHLSASGADNGVSTLINGQTAPIGTGGSVRIQGGASYLSQAAGGNVELIPGVGGDGSSANTPGYVHLTTKNSAGTVLRLGDTTSNHENWISIRAQDGAETNGSGITWYETGTFSVSAPQYGAKIVYDEDSDDFHLGTMNNNTFYKQITIPRGTRAIEVFGHCQPQTDNLYDLGNSSFRWDDVRATNGTIQTSDRNLKTQISGSDLGLDFINDLNPVKYQWLSEGRPHYGLIAQEVSSSLAKSSVHTDNFAGYVENRMFVSASVSGSEKDIRDTADWEMENFTAIPNPELSLRYNEFLSPMIKAIQELSSQVETLKAQISGSGDFNALKTTLTDNG